MTGDEIAAIRRQGAVGAVKRVIKDKLIISVTHIERAAGALSDRPPSEIRGNIQACYNELADATTLIDDLLRRGDLPAEDEPTPTDTPTEEAGADG